MYAIIETGGKQYKVTSGDVLNIEKTGDELRPNVKFDRILFIGGEGQPKIGSPIIAGASVSADVLGPVKGEKIDIQKYKRRKGYHKKQGHRQEYMRVKITGISG